MRLPNESKVNNYHKCSRIFKNRSQIQRFFKTSNKSMSALHHYKISPIGPAQLGTAQPQLVHAYNRKDKH